MQRTQRAPGFAMIPGFATILGFTINEMMVAILIFSILLALGVPTMRTWISNVKVRSVADALQNGVRLAQTESLRRSRQVVFSLTTTLPTANGVFGAITAAGTGSFWSVNVIPAMTSDTATDTQTEFVQGGALGAATGTVSVTGPAEICFNSAGRLVANAATGISGGTCTLPANSPPMWAYNVSVAGADHPLQVQVTLGGKVRLCDPSQTLSSTNTYGC
jgi:type IV fimbrial biogenesis protein FimT